MATARTRYELRVGTRVSEATLAAFRLPVRTTTVVPRNTVFRLRLPADRDLAEVLQRLFEREVQVLEIRRCAAPSPQPRAVTPPPDHGPVPDGGGVVVPFRRRAGTQPADGVRGSSRPEEVASPRELHAADAQPTTGRTTT